MYATNRTPSVAPPLLLLAAQPTPRWRRPVFARRPANGRPSSLAPFLVNAVGRPPHDAFRGGASVHVVASVNRSDLLSAVCGVRPGSPCRAICLAGLAPHYSGWGSNRGTAARRVLQAAPWPATIEGLQARPYDTQQRTYPVPSPRQRSTSAAPTRCAKCLVPAKFVVLGTNVARRVFPLRVQCLRTAHDVQALPEPDIQGLLHPVPSLRWLGASYTWISCSTPNEARAR